MIGGEEAERTLMGGPVKMVEEADSATAKVPNSSMPEAGKDISLRRHMVRGSAWSIGLRWSIRLTGLVSTVILARLLTPSDYGIVAIAALIVGTLEVFAQTGQYNAVVRHPNPTRDHYDSVWTVSLLLGLGLGVTIWAVTPLTTVYFQEPRAKLVVEILALRTMIRGLQNVGIINFARRLNFRRQFYFSVIPELVAFVVTIGFAIVLRNYWALVIGLMSQTSTTVILSYVMDPYRPRICFTKVREIWSFSIWSLFKNLGTYVNSQIDKIAVGGFAGATAMGRYDVARDLAISPTQELINPVVNTLMPVMARVQDDREKRRELYLGTLSWSALICTSASVGVALVAEDMADLVLGPKWHDVWTLMPWFALSWGVVGLTSGVSSVLLALGHPFASARLQWTRNAGFALTIFPVAYIFRDLQAIVITRFLVTLAVSPTMFYALSRVLDVPMRDFVNALWRPMVAGATMAVAVLALNAELALRGPPRLFLDIAWGALIYGATLIVLWIVSGRPSGPERVIGEWAGIFLAPLRRRLATGESLKITCCRPICLKQGLCNGLGIFR
jgi:O-antigen/teichoic acid export membrane protein